LECKASLDTQLPVLQHELKQKADLLYDICHILGKMLYGCVGAIDGWLPQINKPLSSMDVDYFSGHYNYFRLNVQAACNAYCKCDHLEVAVGKAGICTTITINIRIFCQKFQKFVSWKLTCLATCGLIVFMKNRFPTNEKREDQLSFSSTSIIFVIVSSNGGTSTQLSML
jgi:hypothetical protein